LLAAAPLAAVLGLSACGGGGADSSADAGGTGSLTLGVTDMPVDDAHEVNVVFTGVSVKPVDGSAITFQCDDPELDCGGTGSRTIDLLALTGDASEPLLDGATVPAGDYEWIRLLVDAAESKPGSTGASNIVLESNPDGSEVLAIPSGWHSGLKLVSGFHVPLGGSADFTIDFDLRKGVVHTGRSMAPVYMLKPALRLVDNSAAGTIAGTFEPAQYTDGCDTPEDSAVYVYQGASATTGDVGSENEPLASVGLSDDDSDGIYAFEIGFLNADQTYTVAVTCQASDDTETGGDAIDFVDVDGAVEVDAGATTTLTFDGA